jgi:hypothetical protein
VFKIQSDSILLSGFLYIGQGNPDNNLESFCTIEWICNDDVTVASPTLTYPHSYSMWGIVRADHFYHRSQQGGGGQKNKAKFEKKRRKK